MPDVFGDYSCKCDRGMGFVEYCGSCHAEYLQGPCEKGELVVVKEDGAECVKSTCKKGEVMWSDGDCYPYEIPRALFSKLTSDELKYLASYEPTLDLHACTFCNCAMEDSNGKCLTRLPLPGTADNETEDLFKLITALLSENASTSLFNTSFALGNFIYPEHLHLL